MIAEIQAEVARRYKIPVSAMREKRGGAKIEKAKHEAIYIIREKTGRSLAEIGRHFGGRDHSTILYGYRKVQQRMEREARTRKRVEAIASLFEKQAPRLVSDLPRPPSKRDDLWTDDEIETLRNIATSGRPISVAVEALGRSGPAIRSKSHKLGIGFRWHGNQGRERIDQEHKAYVKDAIRGSRMLRDAILRTLRPQFPQDSSTQVSIAEPEPEKIAA